MHHRLLGPLVFVLLAVALAACGGADPDTAAAPATTSPAETAPDPAPFPVEVEADNGTVVIEALPERIVSLSATATESLFAIGAGDLVVAVDDQSNYPEEAPVTDLSGFQPNVEAIAGYEPDLVIAAYDPGGLVDGLEKVGVQVLLQDAAPDLDAAYDQIETLGAVTDRAEEADEVVESMRAAIEDLAASAAAAQGLAVYHELGPDFFSATSNTFIGSVYTMLGLENVADEAGRKAGSDYPQLSAEYIVSTNPDLIVLADTTCCGQSAATVAKRPGWKQIDAVAEGRVVEADDDVASRWGPRTVDFVELVVDALAEPEAGY